MGQFRNVPVFIAPCFQPDLISKREFAHSNAGTASCQNVVARGCHLAGRTPGIAAPGGECGQSSQWHKSCFGRVMTSSTSRGEASASPSGVAGPAWRMPTGLRPLARHALGVVLIATLAFWIWNRGVESRSLHELAAPERQALYGRTLQTLQSSACDPKHGARGLHDYCRRQAEFIVEFPECDQGCSELAKRFLLKPEK